MIQWVFCRNVWVWNCWGRGISFFLSSSVVPKLQNSVIGGKTCKIIGRKVSFLPDTHCVRVVLRRLSSLVTTVISLNIYTEQCRPCLNVVLCGPRDFKIDYKLYICIYTYTCVCAFVVLRIYLCIGREIDEEYRFRSTSGFPECQQSWTTTIKILITNFLVSIRWLTLGPLPPSHQTDLS